MSLRLGRGSPARSAALIALTTLAVHQLRYLLAYGSDAHEQLLRQGHSYLLGALPVLISFATATIAAGLIRAVLGRPSSQASPGSPVSRAMLYAMAILAVFVVQESVEGVLFAGHSSGVAAAFGAGGWLAIPLALAFGALCAVLDGGLAKLEALVAAMKPCGPPCRPPVVAAPGTRVAVPLASLPLAFGLARRPPPLAA